MRDRRGGGALDGRLPWYETVLYSFCQAGGAACTDGCDPVAGLSAAGATGTHYGAARLGGAHGGGTVFAIEQ
jgi:hypothetical protein